MSTTCIQSNTEYDYNKMGFRKKSNGIDPKSGIIEFIKLGAKK